MDNETVGATIVLRYRFNRWIDRWIDSLGVHYSDRWGDRYNVRWGDRYNVRWGDRYNVRWGDPCGRPYKLLIIIY